MGFFHLWKGRCRKMMKMTIEELEFPSVIKVKLLKLINTSRINVEFVSGKRFAFNKTNLGIEKPNIVIFSNGIKYLEMIVYEDDDKFYTTDLSNSTSLTNLVKIINTNF